MSSRLMRLTIFTLLLLTLAFTVSASHTGDRRGHGFDSHNKKSHARKPSKSSSLEFNPFRPPTELKSLEMQLSNAERLKRGMGPNKPHWRRQQGTDAPRPRVSPVAGAPGCQPRTGVLHVRGAGVDGFVSRGSNGFGEYVVSRERGEALMVVFGCGGDVSDLRTTNGFATFPLLGAIQGFSSDNAELRPNALNYLYLGGVAQTAQGARPALVGNSFSTATNDAEASESAIWVVGQAGQVSVRWVNPDGSIPPNNIVYVGGRNVLAIVGDVAAFVAAVENASVVTLTFEA